MIQGDSDLSTQEMPWRCTCKIQQTFQRQPSERSRNLPQDHENTDHQGQHNLDAQRSYR